MTPGVYNKISSGNIDQVFQTTKNTGILRFSNGKFQTLIDGEVTFTTDKDGSTLDTSQITATTVTAGSITSSSGVAISGSTGTALSINKTSNTAGTLKVHCHQMAASTGDSPTQYANEFKGEFLATSGTMDGIASHFHMSGTGTGVLRSIIGVAYLDAGITLSGTEATGSWISGGLFSCSLAGTSVLDGTAVVVYGSYSEVTSAINSTLTSVAHTAAICGYSKLLVKPTSGECSILHLAQTAGATTVNQAIYITGGATIDTFATFDVAASGKAIETNTAVPDGATSYCIHIKVGAVDGYIPVFAAKTF
jgi:hypothetical protein